MEVREAGKRKGGARGYLPNEATLVANSELAICSRALEASRLAVRRFLPRADNLAGSGQRSQ